MTNAVVVTGGTSGIGLATATALASADVAVVAAAIDVEDTPASRPLRAGAVTALHVDVASEVSVVQLFAALDAQDVRVTGLIHAAGIGVFHDIHTMAFSEWRRVISVNLDGAFLCCRAAISRLQRSGGGRIVTIGSIADRLALPGNAAYGAAKAGLRVLTDTINTEHARDGIRATLVTLGAVDTPLWTNRPEFPREQMLKVDDVAAAILAVMRQPLGVRVEEVRLTPAGGVV